MTALETVLASPALVALCSGLMAGGFTLMATRRSSQASRQIERHRFRYEIGRMAAERRLSAYIELAALVAAAYRKKTTTDWNKKEWVTPLQEAKNHFYDKRFFFSQQLGKAFRAIAGSLVHDAPNKDVLEENLNEFFWVVRSDLLLDDLEQSASRAIKAAVDPDDFS